MLLHTLKITILETAELADGWSFERFRESVARRIHLVPIFRWKDGWELIAYFQDAFSEYRELLDAGNPGLQLAVAVQETTAVPNGT